MPPVVVRSVGRVPDYVAQESDSDDEVMTAEQRREHELVEIHKEALLRFDAIYTAVQPERDLSLEDRKFYSIPGEQWGKDRDLFKNSPMLEINKTHLSVMRIISEQRNNRIDVKFLAKDGSSSKLADVCARLLRADEQDSSAENAYDNAFEEAAGGGYGAVRLRAVYEDEEDDENNYQRIRIEPIYDADQRVYFDLGAERQDMSDATYVFLLEAYTVEEYREEFDDDPVSWPQTATPSTFRWYTGEFVYIAEYYVLEQVRVEVQTWQPLAGDPEKYTARDFADDPMLKETLLATGATLVKTKRVKRSKVHKYLLSGSKVLEDCGLIAGKCLPIVPTYGKRWFIDGQEHYAGQPRYGKDAQRSLNMQVSKLVESSARSRDSKPIFLAEQVDNHRDVWANDGTEDFAYLTVDPVIGTDGNPMPAGPVAFTKPTEIPPSTAALIGLTDGYIKDILGDYQQAEKVVSNISAEAMQMAQGALGADSFIFISNFGKAKRRIGEVWLSMAKELYVEAGRRMKGVDSQGGASPIELVKPSLAESGMATAENDLAAAAFDVVVDVGPSSRSQREATVKTLRAVLPGVTDPDTQSLLLSTILMNTEGEGISDLRDYARSQLVNKGVIKPTEEEAKAMAEVAGAPDPQAEYLKAAADQAQAEATKARADVIKTVGETEKLHAQTLEILQGLDLSSQQHAVEMLRQLKAEATPQQAPMRGGVI